MSMIGCGMSMMGCGMSMMGCGMSMIGCGMSMHFTEAENQQVRCLCEGYTW